MSTASAPTVLAGLPIGARAKVTGFDLPPVTHQRLLEMGLTVGTECTLVRYAPLGDPLEIRVRGYHLSLRRTEAAGVQVSVIA